ncbi:ShlB/FhaC/HecB family hemolysin secretion/activation protein [Undibacterium jejuense]|uniref:ShlB/FhaC/HecB family hemolysin secretion/activation protein n=1 Tax=Undibacterium jejuense TaxID=1344949 RepID=A0A923HIT5_9BURK|nr:ShlB/FhaC/HecB family hemolysin secretion/activation protein [Undibacterium jejuense]MBC3863830.1 ShlB/FhaC/HecB family hemolysin secretion/activation protein [Undibacterium jejuense]
MPNTANRMWDIFVNIALAGVFICICNTSPALAATGDLGVSIIEPTSNNSSLEVAVDKQQKKTTDNCSDHRTLTISGLELLSKQSRTQILNNLPSCIEQEELNQFSRLVTEIFIQAGYFKIQISNQSPFGSQQIHLHIEPVRIDNILGASKTINPNFIFPNYKDHPYLNVQDLDQALEQINRLSSNQAEIEIYPSSENGVTISVKNQDKSRFHGSLMIDNTGQSGTGKIVKRANFSLDSPLGFSDLMMFGGSKSSSSQSAYFSYNIPLGYWLISANISQSNYQSILQLTNSTAQQSGQTPQDSIRLERVIQRNTNTISNVFGQLSRTNTRSELLDSVIDVQSPVITKSQLGFSWTSLFPSSSLNTSFEWQRGLGMFKSTKDVSDISVDYPHARFDKFLLSANWSGNTLIQNQALIYEHQFFTQYSKQRLYAIEQMSATDRSSVRGLSDWGAAGDNGFTLRNTYSLPINQYSVFFRPRLGLDIGEVWNSGTNHQKQKAVSASIGLTLQLKTATLDMEYARGKTSLMPTSLNKFSATSSWSF